MKKFAFHTLGCKLNFSESSSIARNMREAGFVQADPGEEANVCFINTCTVTVAADRKSRQAIKKIVNRNPNAFIVVTGCYVQLSPEDVYKIPGVDLILGNVEKFNILKYISELEQKSKPDIHISDILNSENFIPGYSLSSRTRSFFKVQDGCDYNCSYCTIPNARGRSRNNSIRETLKIAREIASTDVKEIVLSGVNVGDFGKSTNESFFDLIMELDKIPGIERFRISSIEPDLLSDNIISFVSNSNCFMPHFHIPLQSGSDRILKLMKRRYNLKQFSDRLEKIHTAIPDVCVGVDIITGFPGETEEDFRETYKFLENKDISYFHIFSFSDRNNTEAYDIYPKTKPKVISGRRLILHKLGIEKRNNFYTDNVGQIKNVLFESKESMGKLSGLTPNYIKTEIPWNKGFVNTILSVSLDGINEDGNMTGVIENG